EALALGGLAADAEDGEARIISVLENGQAAEWFGRMVAAQGGPADFVERWPDRLPSAPVVVEVPCVSDGFVHAIDGRALGEAVVHLGGGRLREGDRVNPSVGLSDMAGLGEGVARDVPLALVHAADEAAAEAAVRAVQAAYRIASSAPEEPPLVLKRVG
ncbi:MAG: thymidine phosphorylase, partial [Rhodobacteraceae bacterium]|nr:thymidine phosphorylase [Paracoccaceae bacterium]